MVDTNVAPGIHRVEDAYTNWFLVEDGDRLTIVDAGVPRSWDSLPQALAAIGRTTSDIEALVLTHAHFDHIGFAERARAELGVPVWVHTNDVPLTMHPRRYGRARTPLAYFVSKPRALPIVTSLLASHAFWPPPIKAVHRYTDGELPVPGSPRVVFTPGHTLGHCALFFPGRDALIAGDAIVMLDPYTGRHGPEIVARAATDDPERALASLDALADTGARTVLTGHGEPWREGVTEAVALAREAGVS